MCGVCDRIKQIKEGTNPYFVAELETGYVVLGDFQHFKGYTVFLCKEHKVELFDLDQAFRIQFLEEMNLVAKAVSNAFHAEKMNYELLGNRPDMHLHWHLFPRVKGDTKEVGPVWWMPKEEMYSDTNRLTPEENVILKEKLLIELNSLLLVK